MTTTTGRGDRDVETWTGDEQGRKERGAWTPDREDQDDGRNGKEGWEGIPSVQLLPSSSYILTPLSNVDLDAGSSVECFGWVGVVEVVVDGIWTIGKTVEVFPFEGEGLIWAAGLESQSSHGMVNDNIVESKVPHVQYQVRQAQSYMKL